MTDQSVNSGGRPKGRKTADPTVNITCLRRIVSDIADRAKNGSPEDQRTLVLWVAAQRQMEAQGAVQ